MADDRSHDPHGQSGGKAGSDQGGSSGGAGLADQAREALRDAGGRASEAWEGASRQGAQAYRQASRALGEADTATMTALFIAGAVGFGLGWIVFGQHAQSDDFVARRMSRSSDHRA